MVSGDWIIAQGVTRAESGETYGDVVEGVTHFFSTAPWVEMEIGTVGKAWITPPAPCGFAGAAMLFGWMFECAGTRVSGHGDFVAYPQEFPGSRRLRGLFAAKT